MATSIWLTTFTVVIGAIPAHWHGHASEIYKGNTFWKPHASLTPTHTHCDPPQKFPMGHWPSTPVNHLFLGRSTYQFWASKFLLVKSISFFPRRNGKDMCAFLCVSVLSRHLPTLRVTSALPSSPAFAQPWAAEFWVFSGEKLSNDFAMGGTSIILFPHNWLFIYLRRIMVSTSDPRSYCRSRPRTLSPCSPVQVPPCPVVPLVRKILGGGGSATGGGSWCGQRVSDHVSHSIDFFLQFPPALPCSCSATWKLCWPPIRRPPIAYHQVMYGKSSWNYSPCRRDFWKTT